jgi:hypothetical protein
MIATIAATLPKDRGESPRETGLGSCNPLSSRDALLRLQPTAARSALNG